MLQENSMTLYWYYMGNTCSYSMQLNYCGNILIFSTLSIKKKKKTFCEYSDSCSKTGFYQKHSSFQLCHIILSFSPPFVFSDICMCMLYMYEHIGANVAMTSQLFGDIVKELGFQWDWQMTLEEIKSLPLSDSCWRWWSAEVNDIQVASAQKSCQQWQHFSLAPQILDLAGVKLFARRQTKFEKSK